MLHVPPAVGIAAAVLFVSGASMILGARVARCSAPWSRVRSCDLGGSRAAVRSNLFDRLLTEESTANGCAANDVRFVQSDWFFASLLHEYRPDPLHVFGG
ncbi:MAG: hypothetical protein CYG61_03525 [Actinobacteria bacterium]|nr:MAG: hypothetical protein CYG61_03525 [Actinomycetota bacterium]